MTDKEHATLTGAFLHEPKGADTAVANRVYISDGLGSGSWGVLSASSLDNSIFPDLLHVREEQPSGTAGGTFTSGDWRTRTLNTTRTNEISGATLVANQITLPAGIYLIEAIVPAGGVYAHVAKLRNITDSTDLIVGNTGTSMPESDPGENRVTSLSIIRGKFTIATNKIFEIQDKCASSLSSVGFGIAGSLGVNEVYTDVMVWKLPQ